MPMPFREQILIILDGLDIDTKGSYGIAYVWAASVMDYLALFPVAAAQEMIEVLSLH